ncbi:KATNB1-like protein 1 [Polypterus senegalus]|uniref:KATNB1-like protein 1 n=1 Tax=Polypterus senegalus TaxID=55291 RepID=UPI001964BA37|nr:KATNB1-like protein 1 [Polypterus senegalus]
MASGDHHVHKGEYDLVEAWFFQCPKSNMLPSWTKNMKEAYFLKEEIEEEYSTKKRSPVGLNIYNSFKVKKGLVFRKKGTRQAVHTSAELKQPLVRWGCDMANKENELSCAGSLHERLHNDRYSLALSSGETTKMDGAVSKYNDYLAEISKDHDTMTQVLFGRNLKLNVALTLWRRNAGELVAYLIRIQDTGVLVDCLPVITKSLQEEKPCMSVGCCVDLFPLVKNMLRSSFEEYLVVGLHWVQSVIKKWWPELSEKGKCTSDGHPEDRNIQVMKKHLHELWEHGCHLCFAPGTTGELAKDIESYLSQLR